ncbi:MAG: BrnT family toxin [Rhodospirillaceae bacterium]|nr:BrnT family toxin [Rhodospirillaceae bacterium]
MAAQGFEWDETKNRANITKHQIDFDDALKVFDGFVHVFRSDRFGEERFVAIGEIEPGLTIAVVYTQRENRQRIISARRARKNEERDYRAEVKRRTPPGTD